MNRRIALLMGASLGAFTGFHLLLPVVPVYVVRDGGSSAEAGLATAALLLATVLTQVQVPALVERLGYRASFTAGLILLGLPALFYPAAGSLAGVLAVTLVRGVGFGVVTVVSGALIAELVGGRRRGRGIGLYGLAGGLPTVFALPLGVWLVERAGYTAVFYLGAAAPLLGMAAALSLRVAAPERGEHREGFFAGLARPELLRPALLFGASTAVFGAVVTFLPLSAESPGSAAQALLVAGVTTTAARWQAGTLGDRWGSHVLVGPSLIFAALGVLALGVAEGSALLLGGAALYGTGFGALQNATMVLMVERVSRAEYGLASTLWNVAFDAGTGLGGLVFGLLIEAAGFAAAFGMAGALLLAALPLAFERPKPKSG